MAAQTFPSFYASSTTMLAFSRAFTIAACAAISFSIKYNAVLHKIHVFLSIALILLLAASTVFLF